MKISKLKFMPLSICCFIALFCSEIQCQGYSEEEKERGGQFFRYQQQMESSPTGSIIAFAGEKPPSGWLLCDGKQYSSLTYPELYDVVKEKYAPEDEKQFLIKRNNAAVLEKTFYLPDLRGRVVVGVDGSASRITSNNTLGVSGGEEHVTLALNHIPAHDHILKCSPQTQLGGLYPGDIIVPHGSPRATHDRRTDRSGGGQPHNNMQPYLILNYIINTGRHNEFEEFNRQSDEIKQLRQEINDLKISQRGCAKAWVVFNGSNPNTLNSFGVSSIVRNSLGNYTINFEKPFNLLGLNSPPLAA